MRYFEFTNKKFPFYALIGAKNIEEAIQGYTENIDEDIEESLPDEVAEEYAREKYLDYFDTEEERQSAITEFDLYVFQDESQIILIDPELE